MSHESANVADRDAQSSNGESLMQVEQSQLSLVGAAYGNIELSLRQTSAEFSHHDSTGDGEEDDVVADALAYASPSALMNSSSGEQVLVHEAALRDGRFGNRKRRCWIALAVAVVAVAAVATVLSLAFSGNLGAGAEEPLEAKSTRKPNSSYLRCYAYVCATPCDIQII